MLFLCQFNPAGYAVPFGKAIAAATGTGMLCHKDGMPAHGGLPPVVGGGGFRQARADELGGMFPNARMTHTFGIGSFRRR